MLGVRAVIRDGSKRGCGSSHCPDLPVVNAPVCAPTTGSTTRSGTADRPGVNALVCGGKGADPAEANGLILQESTRGSAGRQGAEQPEPAP